LSGENLDTPAGSRGRREVMKYVFGFNDLGGGTWTHPSGAGIFLLQDEDEALAFVGDAPNSRDYEIVEASCLDEALSIFGVLQNAE